jgi:glycosyltransferase involved in cell wall biosynthesis
MLRSLLRDVHKAVWQRLPRGARRALLFSIAGTLAPAITGGMRLSPPLIVVGALKTASGLGQSARLCHDALKALGLPVYGVDVGPMLMQPDDAVPFVYSDGRHLNGAGTLILHVNAPLMSLAMLAMPRALVRGKYVVGYWAWELPRIPDDWLPGLRYVNEIWVPSQFTAGAVEAICGTIPVRVVPHPVAISATKMLQRTQDGDAAFLVLNVFNMASSFERKNALGSIAAFKSAFSDDPGARLLVKCMNCQAYPVGANRLRAACGDSANITLHENCVSVAELEVAYRRADVLLSLHRSEGFGLVIAEAMLHGVVVVATNWSGNIDFVSEHTGVPIGFDFVAARDPQGIYDFQDLHWAEARIDEAAAALRQLRANPERALCLGINGAHFARRAFGLEGYTHALGILPEEAAAMLTPAVAECAADR